MDETFEEWKDYNESDDAVLMIASIKAVSVAGSLYRMNVLYAESTALKKDIDPREVGPKMQLEPKENGQRMLYSVEYWTKDWTKQNLLIQFDKIRDVLPTEQL